jgi:alcohol dehydrogenase class IV
MTAAFHYQPKPARVVFGEGSLAELPKAAESLGRRRVLVVSTVGRRRLADRAARHLGTLAGGIFAGAIMHTPTDVTANALIELSRLEADGIVAVGGGSTIGLGKALALRTDLPQIAVPTTYAGSEMTDILGETKDGEKITHRSPKVLPEIVIYDPELSRDLPPQVSAVSGMNAIAHAVEALYAPDTNPVIALMAEEGIRLMSTSLPVILRDPTNAEARRLALQAAWLCGMCLGNAAMALHHKICHVLGGSFGLPHGETHAVMLPYTAAYNAPAAGDAMRIVARALGNNNAVDGLKELKQRLALKFTLADLGFKAADIDRAAEIACANPYANPRPVEYPAVRAMLAAAHAGALPR